MSSHKFIDLKKIVFFLLFIPFFLYATPNSQTDWYGKSTDTTTHITITLPENFWIKIPNPEFPLRLLDHDNKQVSFQAKQINENKFELTLPAQDIQAPLFISYLICSDEVCIPINTFLDLKPPLNHTPTHMPLFLIILTAFMGGLILNIMPCVFPVLSLKIMQVLSHQNTSQKQIRSDFLFTALGIICTFLFLLSVILILKSLGSTIGWGLQFQSPLFIFIMSIILSFFILNLLDLKAFFIPQPIIDFLDKQISKTKHPKKSAFLMGIFITFMATPCAAPFVGTAITAAFAAPLIEANLIFITMGLGFSSPLIMLALFPKWANYIPKSGGWLIVFKKCLSIPILLTLIWLIYLQYQISLFYFAITALCLFLCFLALLKSHKIILMSLLLIFVGFYFYPHQETLPWENYSPITLNNARQTHNYVFVNVTADWCLTCKANKRILLESEDVQSLFKKYSVFLIETDWSKANPDVTDFMTQYHSSAVPTYVIFTPQYKDGIKISELPTYRELRNYLP